MAPQPEKSEGIRKKLTDHRSQSLNLTVDVTADHAPSKWAYTLTGKMA